MKKKILFLTSVVICAAILASGTLAFFTAEDTAHNVITSGGIDIAVMEKMKGDNGTELDFPKDGISGVMPGEKVSKIVSVANIGEQSVWIRVRVAFSVISADNTTLPASLNIRGTAVPVMSFSVGNGWIDGGDGYYYYEKSVPAGEKTAVFFDEVSFSADMSNEYQNCTANIIVSAQAVQTANNPIPVGGAVVDITGWPAV